MTREFGFYTLFVMLLSWSSIFLGAAVYERAGCYVGLNGVLVMACMYVLIAKFGKKFDAKI